MEITLSEKDQQFIEDEITSGRFGSTADAIEEGLRLLQLRTASETHQRQRLRDAIAEGLEPLDRGERLAGEKVFASLREKSRNRRAAKA